MKQFSLLKHTVHSVFKKRFLKTALLPVLLMSFVVTEGQTNHIPGFVASNPTVTINQAALQNDPTFFSPINFSVVFDQPVGGFTTGDIVITGTAGATTALVTGGPVIYNVSISGMISCGTIIANIPAGVCVNSLLEPNLASTSFDNTVTLLLPNPTVTINQAATQTDPTNASPVNFTVQFDQLVSGFGTGDISLSGTAGATTAIVTGSGDRYNVAVSGMTGNGTVIASIAANVCNSYCALPNNASTSTDNTVTISCVPPVVNVTPGTSCGGVAGTGCMAPLTASGNADTYIWSPLAGLYTNCIGTIPYTGDSRTVVYAAPTVNTSYTVKGTVLATGCSHTATAQVNYTAPAPVVIPSFVTMCNGDPPVKLKVVPPAPAIWSPAAGLYIDPALTVPYIPGTMKDSVYARPSPAGTYTYLVTLPPIPPGNCVSAPASVTVTVGLPAVITSQPANQTFCNPGGVAVFSVGVTGALAYQWQLSSNGGATWNNIANAAPYSGINTATLTVNPVSIGMDGYLYRVAVASCNSNILSNAALLSFHPIPTVSITANPVLIGPTQSTTIFSTVTPNPATSFAWYYNGNIIPAATGPSLLVNYGSPGDYQLKVTDANNCGLGVSNILTIGNSFAFFKYIYPNPSGDGLIRVRHPLEPNTSAQRTLNVLNNQGNLLLSKTVTQSIPYQAFEVDLRGYGPGIYWIEWRVAGGGRLAMSKVVVR